MEERLHGGRVTHGVVRIGNTVRRPQSLNAHFIHQLLKHLEEVGFDGAPRFLGIDEKNREILSYVEGEVPPDLAEWTDEQLVAAAKLIRQFHDATEGSVLAGNEEVVCHNDLSPCNAVMIDGLPVALIDFDAAEKGSRISDLAYAVWMWCSLGEEEVDLEMQSRRIKLMCDAYGLKNREKFILEIMKRQQQNIDSCRMNVENKLPGPGQAAVEWGEQCLRWVSKHQKELEKNIL